MMQGDSIGLHQDQSLLAFWTMHAALQICGWRPQSQLHGVVRACLGAGQTKDTVAVVAEMGWMGAQGATFASHTFAFSRTSFETGVGRATP